MSVIREQWAEIEARLAEIQLSRFVWAPARTMLYPKDGVSVRKATQLLSMDSLFLTAVVAEVGERIERARPAIEDRTVFSFRFDLTRKGLYRKDQGWEEFWNCSKIFSTECNFVAKTDIADFYGQIPHRHILSQIEAARVEEHAQEALSNFLRRFGDGHDKGLPVGPHAVHLLAEIALSPIDDLLRKKGYRFCRYIDDYHFFCTDSSEAQLALFDLAELLSDLLQVSLNRSKTRIVSSEEFRSSAETRLGDNPEPKEEEARLLEAIAEVTGGRYEFADFDTLTSVGKAALSPNTITEIFDRYLKEKEYVDYPRLGWLLRRLAQVGAPGGVSYVLGSLEKFTPVIGDAVAYLATAGDHFDRGWPELGEKVLDNLKLPIAERSEYVAMSLIGLFSQQPEMNHFDELALGFEKAKPAVKREILLAASRSGQANWILSLRREARSFDPWVRSAFVKATEILTEGLRLECLALLGTSDNIAERLVTEATLKNAPPAEDSSGLKGNDPTPKEIVISLHGIRTTGKWQKQATSYFSGAGFDYRPLDYGRYSLFRLLFPSSRARRREAFYKEYSRIREENPAARIHLVAHSFGTHISGFAMEKYPAIRFARVIFCGSILPQEFDWSRLIRNNQVENVMNEYGSDDIWPYLVSWIVQDAGPSGRFGFKAAHDNVNNVRRHAFRHSDFFNSLDYMERWVPFLKGKAPAELAPPRDLPPNARFRAFSLVILAAALLALMFVMSTCQYQ